MIATLDGPVDVGGEPNVSGSILHPAQTSGTNLNASVIDGDRRICHFLSIANLR